MAITLGDDGELRLPPTAEERAKGAAALLALILALATAGIVGYRVNWWVTLAVPVVSGGLAYGFLRRTPRLAILAANLLVFLFAAALLLGVAYLVGLVGDAPTG